MASIRTNSVLLHKKLGMRVAAVLRVFVLYELVNSSSVVRIIIPYKYQGLQAITDQTILVFIAP